MGDDEVDMKRFQTVVSHCVLQTCGFTRI